MKHRLARLAVEQHGFTTVALEERVAEVMAALDRHVCKGVSDLSEVVPRRWSPWRTVEFFELVSWIRTHNAPPDATPVRIIAAVSDRLFGLAEHTSAWRSGRQDRLRGGMAHTAADVIATHTCQSDSHATTRSSRHPCHHCRQTSPRRRSPMKNRASQPSGTPKPERHGNGSADPPAPASSGRGRTRTTTPTTTWRAARSPTASTP
jgi:erythromycin esterase